MLTCREMTALVTDYLERRLGRWDRLRFQFHLGLCRHCRRYLRQLRASSETLHHLKSDDVPPETMAALQEQFRRWRSP